MPEEKEARLLKALEALASVEEAPEPSCELHPLDEEGLRARSAALAYIGVARTKASGRVKAQLMEEGFPSYVAEEVVAHLVQEDFIDDRRKARSILKRHQGSRAKSKARLRQLLVEQGIEPGIAEEMVKRLPADRETLGPLLDKNPWSDLDDKARVYRKMLGRGYPSWLVLEMMRERES